MDTNSASGVRIGYIRGDIPEFEVRAYDGVRHEARIPDTLDLQERARLAVNGLTGPTDPLADYEMYFLVRFDTNPPVMQHQYSDHCMIKFMEALPLMRIVSGSSLNDHVERRWMEVALHQLGPDGMAYLPTKGRPWATINLDGHFTEIGTRADKVEQIIDPIYPGRLLSAMALYHRREGGGLWKEAAERLVDALAELAVDRGRYAYFSPSCVWAERGSTDDYGRRHPLWGAETREITLGLIHAYRETGYAPAITLADKLIRYIIEEIGYFGDDGSFLPDRPYRPGWSHFHMHTAVLQSLLEFAHVTGNPEYLELVQKGYQYGRDHGDALLGYFPEWVGSEQLEHSELCEVADMIALALKMTRQGLGDFWDDVDRWVRNMFAEGQLTPAGADRLKRLSAGRPASVFDPAYETIDRVVERNVGAFAGWPKANDWYTGEGRAIMHCCTGNAARALYYVWEQIVTHDSGKLRVNLLLNRASAWADVDSHIPYVGQVDVRVKQPLDLSIRIPEWVRSGDVRVRVSGGDRDVSWDGRYAGVGAVKPGDLVKMTFPIEERTDTVWIEKERYTLVRKGNDVVAIDPPGRYCPLYQREHYRAGTTRWRKAERFVSEEAIHW